jgi:hypothetical protein
MESRPKDIGSYCSDPTTFFDLKIKKTTPPTSATLSSIVRQDPTILIFFESVLGLACQPDPTILGLPTKAKPSGSNVASAFALLSS